MNARSILFATLGGIALLVGALVFTMGGDDAGISAAPARDASPAATPAPLDDAAVTGDPAGSDSMAAPGGDRVAAQTPPAASGAADAPAAGTAAPQPEPSEGASDVGTPPAGAADASQEVAEILRATARRYEDVRALQADFRQELTNTLLGRTTRSAGTLYQRQPDRFLMRFSDPAGDVIVSDGEYFWVYYPSADPKQVIRSSRGAGGLDLRSQFVGDPVRRFESTYHGTGSVSGREAHVLTLDPREPMGYRRLKVWIDAQDHLVRRFELTEENGNVRRFDLSDLRINPRLPDSLFHFEPPAGAVVVSQ